ncbi:protein IQ-DOMAIN 14-like [Fundulus heteroclitus]|uniref:protein IQ-DOMAIN 14-like n=1 Tax=Fundulus heteroclitus TaxID=8078 RepID=UPI00165CDEE8|nr:protein IQ-DOMAIN 14-like [Fundulus heteroclitus]
MKWSGSRPEGLDLYQEIFVLRSDNSVFTPSLPQMATVDEDSPVVNLPASPPLSQDLPCGHGDPTPPMEQALESQRESASAPPSPPADTQALESQRESASAPPSPPADTQALESQRESASAPPSPPADTQALESQRESASAPPSPPADTLPDDESGADENDGWIRFGFIKAVKTVLYRLLTAAIRQYMHEMCYGSVNNRPSQKEHGRLKLLENELYEHNYYGILRVLYNERFMDAVQQFLAARNIHHDNEAVNAVIQAYLYELTMVKRVFNTIYGGYDRLVEENCELKEQLDAITDYWRGS